MGPAQGMWGRAGERAQLRAFVDRARRSVGGTVFVEGEAGIGKTRLVDDAVEYAQAMGCIVVEARCEELERMAPFSALLRGMRRVARGRPDGLAAQVSGLMEAAGGDPGAHFRVSEALGDLVEHLATAHPAVVTIDDIHWADDGTLLALRSLGRRVSDMPVLLIATLRPRPHTAELAAVLDASTRDGAELLRLGALDQPAVDALAADVLGRPPGPRLRGLLGGAGGNPLFVHEVLSALSDAGAVELGENDAEIRSSAVLPSLHESIVRRLSYLTDQELDVLRSAAILGSQFTLADLAVVTDIASDVLNALVIQTTRAGLWADAGEGSLRFRHDVVHEAVVGAVPHAVQAALHLHAAEQLAAAGRPAGRVAAHYLRAPTPLPADAVPWLRQAATDVMSVGPSAAADFLDAAVACLPPEGPEHLEVRCQLAEALVWAGRVEDAERAARSILRTPLPQPLRERATATVVRALWVEGRWGELVTWVAEMVASPDVSEAERARLRADGGIAKLFCGDLQGAEADALAAIEAGERTGDDRTRLLGLLALTPIREFAGHFDEALSAAHDAAALADAAGDPDLLRYATDFGLAMELRAVDLYDEALTAFRRGLARRAQHGTSWDVPLHQAGLALLAWETGRWDDVVAEATAALDLAEELGTRMGIVAAASLLALVRLHRGASAAAMEAVSLAQAELARSGPQWGDFLLAHAQALMALNNGEHDAAMEMLWSEWERLQAQPGVHRWQVIELLPLLVAKGAARQAERVAAAAELVAERSPTATMRALATFARGVCSGDPATLERAADLMPADRVFDAGQLAEAAGRVLHHTGERERARQRYEAAVDRYEALGARSHAARVTAALRDLGVRRGVRGARGRPTTGWGALSPTELEVVTLAAQGLTNPAIGQRMFISRRTVATHLSHAFAKLGVASRVELAAVAAQQGGGAGS